MTDFANNKISHLVASQAPFFVRNDHGAFIDFIEAYYRFLEQNNEVVNRIKNLANYYDVDSSEEPFLGKIYDEYIKLIPRTALVNRPLLIKHVKDFYRARGTEKSISFLIQILFAKDAAFYYPKLDILKASDGKWYIQRTIRIGNIYVDNVINSETSVINNFLSKSIRGLTSNTHATVESIDILYRSGVLVQELSLSGIDNEFTSGEQIATYFTEGGTQKQLVANILFGSIVSTTIVEGGSGYTAGTDIPVPSTSGSGGIIRIGQVTTGNLVAIFVTGGGAGFKNGDSLLITAAAGEGATANVRAISPAETFHQNLFNISISTIDLVANTLMNTASYTTLNNANANVAIQNACSSFLYGPCGPAQSINLITSGDGYSTIPNFDISANTRIRNLGILGRMEIVAGGLNYVAGDWIQFVGGDGFGANGIVTGVAGNGAITAIRFQGVDGQHNGGSAYTQTNLPLANVVSATGSGANVVVTAVIGDGEDLSGGTSTIGEITRVDIIAGGTGYTSAPTLNLSSMGDGTANVTTTVIRGIRTYAGRYLNDDGHLSGYNFLEDHDYYQNFSYVVRVPESLPRYRGAATNLTHPAGMKMFGDHLHEDIMETNCPRSVTSNYSMFLKATYKTVQLGSNSNVAVTYVSHGLVATANVYLEFVGGDTINITNGLFMVVTSNANSFFVIHPNVSNTSGNTYFGAIAYK